MQTIIKKDAMTDSSPIAETAQFVIKILSARPVPAADLPQTIANIRHALERLEPGQAVAAPRPAAGRNGVVHAASPTRRFSTAPAARKLPVSTSTALPIAAAVIPEPVIYPERPRRGRPRRIAASILPEIVEPEVEEAAPVAQPRLLRRAEATANVEVETDETPAILRVPDGAVRGVVKWYDGRAGKGALRLAGISGDVLLDPATLERSGIKRLYKDQEVEATVQEQGGRVQLVSLSLPGRTTGSLVSPFGGEVTSNIRRQPRSVRVEIKSDGIRQSAARAEAEQVLGGVNRIKANRRLIP